MIWQWKDYGDKNEKPKKHNFSDVCKQSVDSKKHLQHTEAQSCFFTLSEVCWFIYLFTQSRVENFELWVKNSASCGCHVSSKTSNQSEEVMRNTTSTPHQPHHTTSTKCCISLCIPMEMGCTNIGLWVFMSVLQQYCYQSNATHYFQILQTKHLSQKNPAPPFKYS